MGLPIDIATTVSDELSRILEAAVNDPDADEPPSLGSVRSCIAAMANGEALEADRLHFDEGLTLLEEIDGLIETFGEDALAIDFVSVKASEDLTRIIEAVMDTGASPPSLGAVRDAMQNGLVAQLAGEGIIDPDAAETAFTQIDALIDRYGRDTAAEEFLRYE
ncbi:MAG: hypothetical protein PHX38_08515 [Sulfuricella sp.]|nr:hypothetical protein [Sulfuricella sp.]